MKPTVGHMVLTYTARDAPNTTMAANKTSIIALLLFISPMIQVNYG
jgi:hypothetical protein